MTPRRISRSLPDKRNNVSKARLPDLAAALPLEQRPPRVTEAAPGPGHPGTATALAGLDATYGSLGRHAEALPLQSPADHHSSGKFLTGRPSVSCRSYPADLCWEPAERASRRNWQRIGDRGARRRARER
jgi:hypothetical protein